MGHCRKKGKLSPWLNSYDLVKKVHAAQCSRLVQNCIWSTGPVTFGPSEKLNFKLKNLQISENLLFNRIACTYIIITITLSILVITNYISF